MLANKSIVKQKFEPLEGSDQVKRIKERMDQERYNTLPVVNQVTQKLIGQINRDQIEDMSDEAPVSDLELDEAVKIYQGQHIFEAARLMLQHELHLLPVVDKEWTYIGVLTKEKVLESLSRMLNLASFGSVITVELSKINFSISEIVQIIETEGANILGVTVETPAEADKKFEVSFKLNLKDVSRVVAALRRYEYTVLAESKSTVFGEDLENRADELLNYIDM
ncbi:CBS domain-containing protein [Fodinibius halophilus]|uniref:CBS domain-containing protein n=1 Tax=Fodinibius halophilus TaxID=1736908 RepID=A0A6M1T697_9BACT|nr:CBS domain-containing protein [Fodinibius halophilus]NGP89617.1 CBS domain-containing protein [Fodinibius halophilus]